jgi:lysophospholipase L1-like esterase
MRLRAAVQNVGLAVASSLAFVLALEGGLRLLRFDLAVPGLEVRRPGSALKAGFTSAHFVPDDEVLWAPRAAYAPFNERRYRGDVVAIPKPAGELRILTAGDSNTLGYAEAWANELASTVDPAPFGARRVTVVNTGVYGYTSFQGRLWLTRFRAYEPDFVLICFGGNDASPNAVPDHALRMGALQERIERWSDRFRLAALVRYAAYRLRPASRPGEAASAGVPRVSVPDYRANLRAMIAESRRMGARPVLLIRPFSYDYYSDPAQPLAAYFKATFEVGQAEDVPVVDLHRMLGCHRFLYQDHSHFNGRGHEVAARLVARALEGIRRDGRYDAEALRYRPADAEYEQLLDALQSKVPLWIDVDGARAGLKDAAGPRAMQTRFDLVAAGGAGPWHIWRPGDTLTMDGPLLCMASPTGAPAILLDLPRDDEGFNLLWIEGDGRADAVARMYWDEGKGFTEDQVVSDVFSGPFQQRPHRMNFLLPRGARGVRLHVQPIGAPSACLRQLWVERIAAH